MNDREPQRFSQPDEAPTSLDDDATLDAEGVAEAKEYGRLKLRCTLLELIIDLGALTLFALWLARPLDEWLQVTWFPQRWLRLGAFFLLLAFGQCVISFPISWYSGYVLEHRYGLSRQSFIRWIGRYAMQHLLASLFGMFLVLGLYAVVGFADGWWWLVAAVATFVVTVVLGQLAPVVILPLFYKIEPLQDDGLTGRFRELAAGTGLRIEGIYRMVLSRETVKANAMLAGLGRTRRVILGDTLLDRFDPSEIAVVLAHEIGHHVHRHIPKMVASGFVVSLLTFFLADLALRWRFGGESLHYDELPVHCLPLILLVASICSTVLGPFLNAISRRYERQCDRYALQRTGSPDAYRSAFTKLAKLNKSDPDPDQWEVFLFHDHPSIAERLAVADQLSGPPAPADA